MKMQNIAHADKFDPDLIFDQIGFILAQNRMLREQLNHINKRIDEESNEKLLWRESSEFWQAQAEFLKERLEDIKNEEIRYAV